MFWKIYTPVYISLLKVTMRNPCLKLDLIFGNITQIFRTTSIE